MSYLDDSVRNKVANCPLKVRGFADVCREVDLEEAEFHPCF